MERNTASGRGCSYSEVPMTDELKTEMVALLDECPPDKLETVRDALQHYAAGGDDEPEATATRPSDHPLFWVSGALNKHKEEAERIGTVIKGIDTICEKYEDDHGPVMPGRDVTAIAYLAELTSRDVRALAAGIFEEADKVHNFVDGELAGSTDTPAEPLPDETGPLYRVGDLNVPGDVDGLLRATCHRGGCIEALDTAATSVLAFLVSNPACSAEARYAAVALHAARAWTPEQWQQAMTAADDLLIKKAPATDAPPCAPAGRATR